MSRRSSSSSASGSFSGSGSNSCSDSDSSSTSSTSKSVSSRFSSASQTSEDRNLKRKLEEVVPQTPATEVKRSKHSHKAEKVVEETKNEKKKVLEEVKSAVDSKSKEREAKSSRKSDAKDSEKSKKKEKKSEKALEKGSEKEKEKRSKSHKHSRSNESLSGIEFPTTPVVDSPTSEAVSYFGDDSKTDTSPLIDSPTSAETKPVQEDSLAILSNFFGDMAHLCETTAARLAVSSKVSVPVRKNRAPVDPNRPKRPQNAFTLFWAHLRAKGIKGEDGNTVTMKEAGAMWHQLPSADKKPFDESASKLKAMFNERLAEYKKQQ